MLNSRRSIQERGTHTQTKCEFVIPFGRRNCLIFASLQSFSYSNHQGRKKCRFVLVNCYSLSKTEKYLSYGQTMIRFLGRNNDRVNAKIISFLAYRGNCTKKHYEAFRDFQTELDINLLSKNVTKCIF